MRALHASGQYSAYAGPVFVTTQGLAAPSGLTATPVGSTRIDLAWAEQSAVEGGFAIE